MRRWRILYALTENPHRDSVCGQNWGFEGYSTNNYMDYGLCCERGPQEREISEGETDGGKYTEDEGGEATRPSNCWSNGGDADSVKEMRPRCFSPGNGSAVEEAVDDDPGLNMLLQQQQQQKHDQLLLRLRLMEEHRILVTRSREQQGRGHHRPFPPSQAWVHLDPRAMEGDASHRSDQSPNGSIDIEGEKFFIPHHHIIAPHNEHFHCNHGKHAPNTAVYHNKVQVKGPILDCVDHKKHPAARGNPITNKQRRGSKWWRRKKDRGFPIDSVAAYQEKPIEDESEVSSCEWGDG